jgi:hypothetical protein
LLITLLLHALCALSQNKPDKYLWNNSNYQVLPGLVNSRADFDIPDSLPDGKWIAFYEDSAVAFIGSYRNYMFIDSLCIFVNNGIYEKYVFEEGKTKYYEYNFSVGRYKVYIFEDTIIQYDGYKEDNEPTIKRIFVIPVDSNKYQPLFQVYEGVYDFCILEEIDFYNDRGKFKYKRIEKHDGKTYMGKAPADIKYYNKKGKEIKCPKR